MIDHDTRNPGVDCGNMGLFGNTFGEGDGDLRLATLSEQGIAGFSWNLRQCYIWCKEQSVSYVVAMCADVCVCVGGGGGGGIGIWLDFSSVFLVGRGGASASAFPGILGGRIYSFQW